MVGGVENEILGRIFGGVLNGVLVCMVGGVVDWIFGEVRWYVMGEKVGEMLDKVVVGVVERVMENHVIENYTMVENCRLIGDGVGLKIDLDNVVVGGVEKIALLIGVVVVGGSNSVLVFGLEGVVGIDFGDGFVVDFGFVAESSVVVVDGLEVVVGIDFVLVVDLGVDFVIYLGFVVDFVVDVDVVVDAGSIVAVDIGLLAGIDFDKVDEEAGLMRVE